MMGEQKRKGINKTRETYTEKKTGRGGASLNFGWDMLVFKPGYRPNRLIGHWQKRPGTNVQGTSNYRIVTCFAGGGKKLSFQRESSGKRSIQKKERKNKRGPECVGEVGEPGKRSRTKVEFQRRKWEW